MYWYVYICFSYIANNYSSIQQNDIVETEIMPVNNSQETNDLFENNLTIMNDSILSATDYSTQITFTEKTKEPINIKVENDDNFDSLDQNIESDYNVESDNENTPSTKLVLPVEVCILLVNILF